MTVINQLNLKVDSRIGLILAMSMVKSIHLRSILVWLVLRLLLAAQDAMLSRRILRNYLIVTNRMVS